MNTRPHSVQCVNGVEAVRAAVATGVLTLWGHLAASDATATAYQGPDWCLAWYKHYADDFEAVVLAVMYDATLVGVVPLCRGRNDGALHFAGTGFSDYRDVISVEGHREDVLRALLSYYRDTRPPNVFRVGSMTPNSPSAVLLPRLAAELGIRAVARQHSGWRYLAASASPENNPLRSKTVKYNYNWYKRGGGSIAVERVTERTSWEALQPVFLAQHSLRQLSSGRALSFDDPRKIALFNQMFDSPSAHFCVLRAGDRVIATHFGFTSGRLLHWGAPAFDIRDSARSPSLLLVALIMADLERWQLDGLDLTIGEGFMKERFSNVRVDLPSLDLYPDRFSHSLDALRQRTSAFIKEKPRVLRLARQAEGIVRRPLQTVRKHGALGSVRLGAKVLWNRCAEMSTGLVLTVTPESFKPAPHLANNVSHNIDAFEDLLLWNGTDHLTRYVIRESASGITANIKTERTLHTLLVDGQLACWGYSYLPKAPAMLTETGNLELQFEPGATSLYAFYTVPEFRGRGLYQQLLSRIIEWRFESGVSLAYITVLQNNVASLRAIERVGFTPRQRNTVRRVAFWRSVHRSELG